MTLRNVLARVQSTTQHLSEREFDDLANEVAAHSTGQRVEMFEERPIVSRMLRTGRGERLARAKFFECLEDQMLVEMDDHALSDAKLLVARAKQLEGSLTAPHSDVVKAELTQEQREEYLARSNHRQKTCKSGLNILLSQDSAAAVELVLPILPALPKREDFLRLATRGGAISSHDLSSNRFLFLEIGDVYDEAAFDVTDVERLQKIRDDAQQSQTLIEYRYRGGEASMYDVTAAQDVTVQAEREWLSALLRALRSHDELDRLTGKEQ